MTNTHLPVARPRRVPWNKGGLVGQKRPLQPKQVWAIQARRELSGNLRDPALFNLGIDSKLRGCHLARLRVADLVIGGSVRERVPVIQSKTGRPVQFEVSETTFCVAEGMGLIAHLLYPKGFFCTINLVAPWGLWMPRPWAITEHPYQDAAYSDLSARAWRQRDPVGPPQSGQMARATVLMGSSPNG